MPNTLLSLQKNFQAYLLDNNHAIVSSIVNTPIFPAKKRLSIYGEGYQCRLEDALKQDYPVLFICMGEALFLQHARDYIATHPSTYRSIRWFGAGFSSFLREINSDEFLCFADMALFEWTLGLAFDAPDHAIVTEQDVQRVLVNEWPSLCFTLHPSCHSIVLHSNAVAVWKRVRAGKPATLRPHKRGTSWVVWRRDVDTFFYAATVSEAWALQAIQQRLPISEVGAGLSRWVPMDRLVLHAATLLKSWVHRGLMGAMTVI